MNRKDKNKKLISINRGVSLISLIITILVIIILAAIAIYGGFMKNVDEANFSKMYNEFFEVEAAIAQRGYEHKLDSNVYPYEYDTKLTDSNSITINNVTYGEGYYLVTPSTLKKLGVDSAVREYVVKYSTGEVILRNPYLYKDEKVFTKKDLLEVYTNNSVITIAEYDDKKGVNKPMLLDGMLPVKYDGSNWIVTSVNDEDWYDYSIGSSGGPVRYANVMLLDDTTVRDLNGNLISNERIRGMNIENLVGMKIEIEGSMFVWIPRYTYKQEGNSVSIVYSNLTRDYTSNGYTKSPAFYYGEYIGAEATDKENTGYVAGGRELTGIWISKYVAGYVD